MIRFFKKLRRITRREIAPQLAAFERRSIEQAGPPPGGLPYETYERMQRDSMVQTALAIKRLGVLAAPWSLETLQPRPEADRRIAFVMAAFDRMEGSPSTILHHAMDAFAKGWSVQEKVYSTDGRHLWLDAVRPKAPERFGLDVDAFGTIKALRLAMPGEDERLLPPQKFVVYVNRPGYGVPKGRSDLDAAYRHWDAKSALLSAWRIHLERFAMPTVLGKYERGTPGDEVAALLDKLQNLHQSTAIAYPSEIAIDTLGGFKEPSTGFQEAVEFHNREIARAILGQTLTTDEGRRVGSLALGKVHLQVLLLQLDALRRELADTVMTEQVIRPLIEMNFGPGPVPRFVFEPPRLEAFGSATSG